MLLLSFWPTRKYDAMQKFTTICKRNWTILIALCSNIEKKIIPKNKDDLILFQLTMNKKINTDLCSLCCVCIIISLVDFSNNSNTFRKLHAFRICYWFMYKVRNQPIATFEKASPHLLRLRLLACEPYDLTSSKDCIPSSKWSDKRAF